MSLTPVYDSHLKKYETTRRRIFKDSDGKYKEKLEVINCEKRTLFGIPPFEGNSNWKLEDLSDIDNTEPAPISSQRKNNRKSSSRKGSSQNMVVSSDFSPSNAEDNQTKAKSNINYNADPETVERQFKDTLAKIISRLRNKDDDKNKFEATEIQGVKKIFEKKRDNQSRGFDTSSNTDVYSTQ